MILDFIEQEMLLVNKRCFGMDGAEV